MNTFISKINNLQILWVACCIAMVSCNDVHREMTTKFSELSAEKSGVLFTNTITENDTLSYFKFPYIFMGGGVSIGDINNDGLSDLFLTGNMVPNKLYLNKGNFEFEDITENAGISGDQRWYTGATMTDINNDGFLDIYLSVSGLNSNTENQLFVNNGDLSFTESASEYGINDKSNSIQSTFFDYDNDGDIDLFVANYPSVPISQGNLFYDAKMKENDPTESGHLYRNDGKGKFSDITQEAGVQNFGLTLGLIASDFNNDGWQDLYLSNDFNVPDYFYINNQDGTFREVVKEATGHIAMFGMGIDASDFNNDGLIDLVQAEMSPEDYVRARVNMASMSPKNFEEGVSMGFHYQYMQNSLQLNNGMGEQNNPMMSEISRFANMASTDWSWSTLFADLDNDGWKDIYITNGMKRDVNDNDVNNRNNPTSFKQAFNIDITDYPSEPLENYVYRNKGGIAFEKSAKEWGLDFKGFSNGMAYGDLDNDGDLDLVINNIDSKASLFKNETKGTNYLRIALKGSEKNPLGLGAKVTLIHGENQQVQELTLTRGFQSSSEPILHFGLGTNSNIDELQVTWSDGSEQIIENPMTNQLLSLDYRDSQEAQPKKKDLKNNFKNITSISNIDFHHTEDLYNDYQTEPLLPYRYSMIGGALAVGDVNSDGLEDFYTGNAAGSKSVLYLQNKDATFSELEGPWAQDASQEDMGALFFDFDKDGDQDLYVVSGGSINLNHKDRLYVNTKDGFVKTESALPEMAISGKSIATSDMDKDGFMDIFIGGRNVSGKYPYPAASILLRNVGGKDMNLKFEMVESPFGKETKTIGMVTDAVWADLDGDSWEDLILAGEWMPITVYKNNKGVLVDKTEDYGLKETKGWWNSLHIADIDQDGDVDIIGGNLGLNHKYKTSLESPFEVYAADFDENGSNDIVFTYNKKGMQVPLRGRECSSQQVPAIGIRYKSYRDFAKADLVDIYGQGPLNKALHYKADTFAHLWFENKDGKEFQAHELPVRAQLSTINSIVSIDYNNDKYPDILVQGNLYPSEAETPRSDAGLGLILLGSSKGYREVVPSESGFLQRSDVKDCKKIQLADNRIAYLIASNNSAMKLISYQNESITLKK